MVFQNSSQNCQKIRQENFVKNFVTKVLVRKNWNHLKNSSKKLRHTNFVQNFVTKNPSKKSSKKTSKTKFIKKKFVEKIYQKNSSKSVEGKRPPFSSDQSLRSGQRC